MLFALRLRLPYTTAPLIHVKFSAAHFSAIRMTVAACSQTFHGSHLPYMRVMEHLALGNKPLSITRGSSRRNEWPKLYNLLKSINSLTCFWAIFVPCFSTKKERTRFAIKIICFPKSSRDWIRIRIHINKKQLYLRDIMLIIILVYYVYVFKCEMLQACFILASA